MHRPDALSSVARIVPVLLLLGTIPLFWGCSSDDANPNAPVLATPTRTGPVEPVFPESVEGQVVVSFLQAEDEDEVAGEYQLSVLDQVPSRPVFLMQTEPDVPADVMAQALQADPRVQNASPNYVIGTVEDGQTSATFNEGDFTAQDVQDQGVFQRLRLAEAQQYSTGAGVLVAVLDTGVDLDHPDLAGHLVPGWDFVEGDMFPDDVGNDLDDDADGRTDEGTGHGTHVAGLIAAIAPSAQILPVRVLNSDGKGTLYDLLDGWYFALSRGALVLNASLGLLEESPVLHDAVELSQEQVNCFVVASAGQTNSDDRAHWPSGFGDSYSVTAVDSLDVKWAAANFGSKVDLAAPGVGILSIFADGGYAVGTGTSMSAAMVSGAAALLRAFDPSLQAEDVGERLGEFSVPIGAQNPGYELGEGRLDFLAPILQEGQGGGEGGDGDAAPPRDPRGTTAGP